MAALDYLNDPANAARHRAWKQERLRSRKQKARAAQERLEAAIQRGEVQVTTYPVGGRERELQRLRVAKANPRITPRKRHRIELAEAKLVALIAGKKPEVTRKPKPPKKSQKPNPPKAFQGRPVYREGLRAEEFYQTREWLELRYTIIRKYGAKCMCCNTSEGRMHIDHILPRSKFPKLELNPENLQVLCEACNIGKSNKDVTDWRTKGAMTQPG